MTDPIASRDLREPGDYLNADDLLGLEVTLTIDRVYKDSKIPSPVNGRPSSGHVLLCKELRKNKQPARIILNNTRRESLISLFGQNWKEDWPGKKFVAYCAGQNNGKGEPELAKNGKRMVAIKGAK